MTDGAVVPLARAGELDGTIIADDVAQLAREFPDFEIGVAYVTGNSGPDYRYLWARGPDHVLVAAPERALLATQLRRLALP